MDDFATFIQKQRDDLHKKRADLVRKRTELDSDILAVDTELKAITAYEQAKTGKTKPTATRQRRGGVRENVLEAITQSGGINRADLLVHLNAKGDTKAEQSISNALANLKKAGAIQSVDGKYTATNA